MFVDVVPDQPVRQPLTYRTTPATLPYLSVGSLVIVPFGRTETFGVVVKLRRRHAATLAATSLKPIASVVAPHWAPAATIRLADALAAYTHEPVGVCLFRLLPPSGKRIGDWPAAGAVPAQTARDAGRIHCCAPWQERLAAYVGIARKGAAGSRQTLIICPTKRVAELVVACTAAGLRAVAVSGQQAPTLQRAVAKQAAAGDLDVIVGTRQIVGWPVRSLGTVVVDDATNPAHRDDQRPYADTATIAWLRSQVEQCRLVLGSALPTFAMAAAERRGTAIRLKTAGARGAITIARTPQSGLLVPRLLERIADSGATRGSVAIVAPRAGSGGALHCRSCGWRLRCAHCGGDTNADERSGEAQCYDCRLATKQPGRCPECGSYGIAVVGIGDTSVAAALTAQLGGLPASIVIGTEQLLDDARRFETIAFVYADSPLLSPDLDRPFVFGRSVLEAAGMADTVIVQTRDPAHPFWKLLGPNPGAAVVTGLARRHELGLPPFARTAWLDALPAATVLPSEAAITRQARDGKRDTMEVRIVAAAYDTVLHRIAAVAPRVRIRTDSMLYHV